METTPYSGCPKCGILKKETKKLKRKVRDLKDRMRKNQNDWAMSFKELENQKPALVTSGVLRFHCPLLAADGHRDKREAN